MDVSAWMREQVQAARVAAASAYQEVSESSERAVRAAGEGLTVVGEKAVDALVAGVRGINYVMGPGVTLSCTPRNYNDIVWTGGVEQSAYAPVEAVESLDAGDAPIADRFVAAHNRARAQVNPAPTSPLTPLIWSEDAAAYARQWASRCEYVHSKGGPFGENLYALGGGRAATPEDAVESWAGEAKDYNYQQNSCTSGEQCGHYTQIVWSATTAVGCAVQHCQTGSPFPGLTDWDYVVCSYAPPGNYIGQRPY